MRHYPILYLLLLEDDGAELEHLGRHLGVVFHVHGLGPVQGSGWEAGGISVSVRLIMRLGPWGVVI